MAPAGIEDVDPYGQVLLVKIVSTMRGASRTGLFVLLSIGEAAGEFVDELRQVDFVGFEDPAGGRGYVEVEDLIAYSEGSLDEEGLYDKLIFDY